MVSCTALTSNTPGRAGIIAIVAFLMASSTTADMFGGVSMNTHSIPSRLAGLAVALGGADDPADGIDSGFDRRFIGAAQLVPESERPLRIGIDKQTRLCCF